jgi:hypothetical protein
MQRASIERWIDEAAAYRGPEHEQLVSELHDVFLPTFGGHIHRAPGWFFSAVEPRGEIYAQPLESALRIAGTRNGYTDDALLLCAQQSLNSHGNEALWPSHQIFAALVADACQLTANMLTYMRDYKIIRGREYAGEQFSARSRIVGSGDCEDLAKEVSMMASAYRSFPVTPNSNVLLRAAKDALDGYVCGQTLGAVTMSYLGSNDKTGRTANGLPSSYHAHMWCGFYPAVQFDAALQFDAAQQGPHRDGARVRSVRDKSKDKDWLKRGRSLRILHTDGTNLKQVLPELSLLKPLKTNCAGVKNLIVQTESFYRVALSVLLSGHEVTIGNLPVYQLVFQTISGQVGVFFKDIDSNEARYSLSLNSNTESYSSAVDAAIAETAYVCPVRHAQPADNTDLCRVAHEFAIYCNNEFRATNQLLDRTMQHSSQAFVGRSVLDTQNGWAGVVVSVKQACSFARAVPEIVSEHACGVRIEAV